MHIIQALFYYVVIYISNLMLSWMQIKARNCSLMFQLSIITYVKPFSNNELICY